MKEAQEGVSVALGEALGRVPTADVLRWIGKEFTGGGAGEFRLRCPNTQGHKNGDAHPSLCVGDGGKYHCKACGLAGGSHEILVANLLGWDLDRARRDLCHEFLHPVVPEAVIQEAKEKLLSNGDMKALGETRRIRREVLEKYDCGLDSRRVTIPIRGPYGLAMDLRRWDAFRRFPGEGKNLPYESGYGKAGIWWPMENQGAPEVFLCEGEPDTLAALTLDLRAMTPTGGAGGFKNAEWEWAEGKSLTACMHRDEAGMTAGQVVRERAWESGAARLRFVQIPAPHKDLIEWLLGSGEGKVLEAIEMTAWETRKRDRASVALSEVDHAALVGLEITLEGQVSRVAEQAYIVPRGFRVACAGDAGLVCVGCPNNVKGLQGNYSLEATHEAFLNCVEAPDGAVRKVLKHHAGIPMGCESAQVEILSHQNALRTALSPGFTRGEKDGIYALKSAIFVGNVLEPGATVRFRGYTRPHPKTQEAITVLTHMVSALAPHRGFELPEEHRQVLDETYGDKEPEEALHWTASMIARYFTKITRRDLVHVAADLAFHSVLEFYYGGKLEPGWLDVLVVGDTSTGKTQAVEGMMRLYGLGSAISGKRCTQAGLLGGTIRHGKGFDVVPGAWALSDGGLTILDERTKPEVFVELTRARREGIAEFTQAGASHRMRARVRKVWVMNPPPGKSLGDYRYAAEVLRELVEAEEDVARWDMAVGVVSDVEVEDIVQAGEPVQGDPPMAPEVLRSKVRWAWSRKPEQVRWGVRARTEILTRARALVRDFASPAGLVQRGNTHQKLRKMAVAIAAATWGTPDGTHLVVREAHVATADAVLREALAGSLKLDELSLAHRSVDALGDPQALIRSLAKLGAKARSTARKLLIQEPSFRMTWEAMFPGLDARDTVNLWLREGALKERDGKLSLTAPMSRLLREKLSAPEAR